jgi:hypothetical protein
MSSARQGLTIIGQVAGAAFGGPVGAAIGGIIGGELGGFIDGPPEGPRLDDLSAPAIQYGSQVPWVEGRVWCDFTPLWWSGLRESSSGGKGGDSGVEEFSYHADMLGRLANGANVADWCRIEVDGEIVATRLADSSPESIANSLATDRWSDFTLLTGGPSQTPWPVMETAVGASNAIAYIGQCTAGFQNFWMKNGRQPSRIRIEVTTKLTLGDAIWRNHVTFGDDTAADTSYYAATPSISGTDGVDYAISGGVFRSIDGGGSVTVSWSGSHLLPQDGVPMTLQAKGCLYVTAQPNTPSLYQYDCGTFVLIIGCNSEFGHEGTWRFNIRYPDDPSGSYFGPYFTLDELHHCELIITPAITGTALTGGTIDIYIDGVLTHSDSLGTATLHPSVATCAVYSPASGFGQEGIKVEYAGTAFAALHSANFTPPSDLPPADGPSVVPVPEDLQDVLERMALRCAPLTADNIDFSAAAGKPVYGYKYVGSAAQAMQPWLTRYYLDVFCDDKIRLVQRGGAVEQTVPFAWSGSPGDGFPGLVRDNDVEVRKRTAVTYINRLSSAGENDTVNGEREAVGEASETISLPIYLARSEAQAVADTSTWDKRVATHTATIRVGARHGLKVQPGSVVTVVDHKGNSYRVLVRRATFDRWAWACEVRLDDPHILTSIGIAVDEDERVIEVAGPPDVTLWLVDAPIVRDADNDYGLYAAVTATGDYRGARVIKSADDVSYAAAGVVAQRATVGIASGALAGFAGGHVWDGVSSLTVVLDEGSGGTLASATKTAIEDDRTINVAWLGVHGRWECIRYANAVLIGDRTYLLSDFLRGQQGTEHNIGNHDAGDTFVKVQTAGMLRIQGTADDVGATRYYKAVPTGRNESTVGAQVLVTDEVGLKPLAPVDLHVEVSGGQHTVSWNRRSRLSALLLLPALAPPLGEASESYDWELDDSGTVEAAATVAVPQAVVQAYDNDFALAVASQFVYEQGGVLHSFSEGVTSISYRQHTPAGAYLAGLFVADYGVFGVANDGAIAYVAAYNGPLDSAVRRIDTAVPTITHTELYGPGQVQGVAFDGTDVWTAHTYTGLLRQHDKDDLTELASHAVGAGISQMVHDSGSLWICDTGADEVVQWDIATTVELQRFACVNYPLDILVVGSLIFVAGITECGVYSDTGTELNRFTIKEGQQRRRMLARFDGKVAVGGPSDAVLLMDETTGLVVDSIPLASSYTVAGASSDHLFVAVGSSSAVASTQAFAEAVSLAGKTFTVQQNSAAVGRGYPAEVEL